MIPYVGYAEEVGYVNVSTLLLKSSSLLILFPKYTMFCIIAKWISVLVLKSGSIIVLL